MRIPAFTPNDGVDSQQEGISLRDYFAGQALAGLLASPGTFTQAPAGVTKGEHIAGACFQYADAMLKQRVLELEHKCNG